MQLQDDLLKILIGAQHGLPARGTNPDDVIQAIRRSGPIVQADPHFPFPTRVEDSHFTHGASAANGSSSGPICLSTHVRIRAHRSSGVSPRRSTSSFRYMISAANAGAIPK